jgi:uncharacterized repeat protein (TIGR03803 family)
MQQMVCKKWFASLGLLRRDVSGYGGQCAVRGKVLRYGRWSVALTIIAAALTLASNATSSQPGGEPDAAGAYNLLHFFTWAKTPFGNLTFDAAGNLYGTTANYGTYGDGAVYKLKPNPDGTWAESVLHSFAGPDGSTPYAGLVLDTAGNLYGTTVIGGSSACSGGCGVVFKLAPTSSGWKETVLHTFIGFGAGPYGPAILDPAGNLYGTTSDSNHAFDYGLVFEIAR